MSRIPIVNPNRFYTNKEIDLISLLPNSMKETEIQTFLELFEKYLNEMYEGATKYVAPENLEAIIYTAETIWTDGYQYVTGPYDGFLTYFKAGDFIKRNNETKYYKIEEVVDDSTLKLTELYVQEVPPSYLKSAYWDQFTSNDFTNFWIPANGPSPVGMDGTVPLYYRIDPSQNRIVGTVSGTTSSVIATKIFGEYQFEFGFHRCENSIDRKNMFGFDINPSEGYSDLTYRCVCVDNILKLLIYDQSTTYVSAYINMNEEEDDWVVNVFKRRDTNTIKFLVTSLKAKTGTIPVGFTSAVGFFNRWEYEREISAAEGFDNHMKLNLINGLQQGFNYVYFESDLGFPGEADSVDLTSILKELAESQYIYATPFGRTFENDGETDIYQFYFKDKKLRIRDLTPGFDVEATEFRQSINHISILEKIRRLTELHDPDLIDIEYINYFAKYLGYDVKIDREMLGVTLQAGNENWGSLNDEEKQDIEDKYLRFIVSNLPTWYKIKTTDNAIAIMLYSFGLVTEIKHYFCSDYGDVSTWTQGITGTSDVLNTQFQTPHFSVNIDLDQSISSIINDLNKMDSIISAILSVKPINTVFHGLAAYFKRNLDMIYVSMVGYYNQYVYIK